MSFEDRIASIPDRDWSFESAVVKPESSSGYVIGFGDARNIAAVIAREADQQIGALEAFRASVGRELAELRAEWVSRIASWQGRSDMWTADPVANPFIERLNALLCAQDDLDATIAKLGLGEQESDPYADEFLAEQLRNEEMAALQRQDDAERWERENAK